MHWLIIILLIPYIYVTLKIYKGLISLKPFHPSKSPSVFLSVIVACRNEEKNLPSLLSSIGKQGYPAGNFEVIIIDDNSTDSTFALAGSNRGGLPLKVVRNAGRGKKDAIATGVRHSSGNIIVTTDADCHHSTSWLGTIASYFEEMNPDLLICPVIISGGNGLFSSFQETEFLSLQAITAGTAANGKPVMCNGANLAFTKVAYQSNAENLHPELLSGDDVFLLHSLAAKKNSKISWLESVDSLVRTMPVKSIGSFLKQRARWISKAGDYSDSETSRLGIVTFVTILAQAGLLLAGVFDVKFLPVFAVYTGLKSVPDVLLIADRAAMAGKRRLLWYFLPAQLIYPFYVLAVSFTALITSKRYRIS